MSDNIYKVLGAKIKLNRVRIGLTQAGLGIMTGYSRVSIANIEAGHHKMALHRAVQICEVLGIRIF